MCRECMRACESVCAGNVCARVSLCAGSVSARVSLCVRDTWHKFSCVCVYVHVCGRCFV